VNLIKSVPINEEDEVSLATERSKDIHLINLEDKNRIAERPPERRPAL